MSNESHRRRMSAEQTRQLKKGDEVHTFLSGDKGKVTAVGKAGVLITWNDGTTGWQFWNDNILCEFVKGHDK